MLSQWSFPSSLNVNYLFSISQKDVLRDGYFFYHPFFFSFCFLLKAFEIASESLAPERWGLGSRELNTEMPINSPWSILRQTVLERPRADLIQGERPDL